MTWKRHDGARHESFVLAVQAGMQALAQDRCLGLQDLRVFLWLLGEMEWHGLVRTSQATVARALGMSRQNVWLSIRRLLAHELLLQGEKNGPLPSYYVNSTYAYRGPLTGFRQAQRQVTARQRLEAVAEALREGQALDVATLPR